MEVVIVDPPSNRPGIVNSATEPYLGGEVVAGQPLQGNFFPTPTINPPQTDIDNQGPLDFPVAAIPLQPTPVPQGTSSNFQPSSPTVFSSTLAGQLKPSSSPKPALPAQIPTGVSLSAGKIAAITVGLVSLTILISLLCWYLRRRFRDQKAQRRRQTESFCQNPIIHTLLISNQHSSSNDLRREPNHAFLSLPAPHLKNSISRPILRHSPSILINDFDRRIIPPINMETRRAMDHTVSFGTGTSNSSTIFSPVEGLRNPPDGTMKESWIRSSLNLPKYTATKAEHKKVQVDTAASISSRGFTYFPRSGDLEKISWKQTPSINQSSAENATHFPNQTPHLPPRFSPPKVPGPILSRPRPLGAQKTKSRARNTTRSTFIECGSTVASTFYNTYYAPKSAKRFQANELCNGFVQKNPEKMETKKSEIKQSTQFREQRLTRLSDLSTDVPDPYAHSVRPPVTPPVPNLENVVLHGQPT
ncbi:hypothetical protein O181_003628 [Austropuccinia psidii MF-1]|uniref:Uncharacterized protein n=1 Tax=Austropuccinia psidii MF-1 TaxID=1389203 RepID=A0A9Q3GDR4_9BASI|nr:hypothetical protein [Austropuccinia psidii MF-1]